MNCASCPEELTERTFSSSLLTRIASSLIEVVLFMIINWFSADHTRLQWPEGLSEEGLLRWWITENGGYIHPALHLTESPTCNGR